MALTTDPNDPRLDLSTSDGMNEVYLVLSDEERAKGFVRPVYRAYRHAVCGGVTTMGLALSETYAAQPDFYGATFCAICGSHFPVGADGEFTWVVSPGEATGFGKAGAPLDPTDTGIKVGT
jgi:hypothetical protein